MRRAWLGVLVGTLAFNSAAEAQGEVWAALHRGDYEAAIEGFERELRARPSGAAVRGLARALSEVGRYREARTVVERHVEPLAPELWNTLGEVLLFLGELRDAEAAFETAINHGASDSLIARLNRALVWHRRGAHVRANAEFASFIDVYNSRRGLSSVELMAVAVAVQHLGASNPELFRDALRAYDQAVAADQRNLEARARVGELFLDRYNSDDAAQTFEEILALNPRYARAVLGKARTRHFDGSDEALELTEHSLRINPNLVAARVLLGTLYLELENYDVAAGEARKALDVDPNSLDALSILAASQYFRGDRTAFEASRRQILALNPRYAGLYTRLAELSARIRRYADAVEFARQAVKLDSTSWQAFAELGRNELRLGAIEQGARHLETAFAGDPYDVWTKNTLDLLDTLRRYPITSSPRFQFVIDGTESALLTLYASELAEEAYRRLSERYRFRPTSPIRVEIYPSHSDFSVRTVGLVGLGALGVSFGPVIAMDSPSARDAGHFNWGSTLWHELAHTFHLEMTDHRVPRWFTEGLAVLEERRARPGWGDDVSPGFLIAFLQDRLVPVSDLNRGFTRPAYPEQIIFSYYQASLVCELIESQHGFDALHDMLSGYREGKSTAELFRTVLGSSLSAYDDVFEQYVRERFQGALVALEPAAREAGRRGAPSPETIGLRAQDPADFVAQLVMGQRLVRDGKLEAAVPYLERAKALFPEYAGADSPYWLLAQIAKQRGDLPRAARELSAMTAINERHYRAFVELAEIQEALNQHDPAARTLEEALYVFPFDVSAHDRLAKLYAKREAWPAVIRERGAILALRPVDRAEAGYQLALAQFEAGNHDDARRTVLGVLEHAPNFAQAQELLLAIHAARKARTP